MAEGIHQPWRCPAARALVHSLPIFNAAAKFCNDVGLIDQLEDLQPLTGLQVKEDCAWRG
jgi:hypothetical protein